MELEFDKEIDAILRRAGRVQATVARGEHLDADVLAAFAEGALPHASRAVYTRHLADCDPCRKLLSQAITMNTATDAAPVGAASLVAAPTAEASSSWFAKLFRAPNLALAMGALVLTFSGVLGYLVLQDRALDGAMVSQSEPEMQQGGPYAGIEPNEPMATSNAAAPAANSAPAPAAVANSAVVRGDRPEFDSLGSGRSAEESKGNILLDGVSNSEAKPAAAAPPKPAITDTTAAERDREKLRSDDKDAKDENILLGGVRQETEDRRASGTTLSKKKDGGPTRSTGPVQSQSQINTQTYDMPVMRSAGGKTFTNRNGAWYDTAYRGQATTNVRRSSDEYKKLDRGLRSIAETLGGVVIVVWKERAYRIS